jgi:hypothetical protein
VFLDLYNEPACSLVALYSGVHQKETFIYM